MRRLPQLGASLALFAGMVLPFLFAESSQQFIYAEILAFALCATSVTVLTGWGGQLSLGQMAFAGIGALSAAAFERGVGVDLGWGNFHFLKGSLPALPFGVSLLLGAVVACLVATLIGIGALRVRGLLLAASTLAFAIAAQAYVFPLQILSLGQETVQMPRGTIGPFDVIRQQSGLLLRHAHRAGGRAHPPRPAPAQRGGAHHHRRTRERERGGGAHRVARQSQADRLRRQVGSSPGWADAILGGLVVTIGYTERFFTVDDSLALVAMAVIGGLGGRAGAVIGALWVIGLPAFWPDNNLVPLLTSSIGLLIILLYIPGGFTQIGYWFRDEGLRFLETRLPPLARQGVGGATSSLSRVPSAGERADERRRVGTAERRPDGVVCRPGGGR